MELESIRRVSKNPLCVSVVPYRVVIFPSRKLSGASTSSNAWVSLGGTHGQTSKIPVPRNQVELVFQVCGCVLTMITAPTQREGRESEEYLLFFHHFKGSQIHR